MTIRSYQTGDERQQAAVFNSAAFVLPGFKPATEDDVRKRTRARGFDPSCRVYAEENGRVVGYCSLDRAQGRISVPWCMKGYESLAGSLFKAVLAAGRAANVTRVFAAYRRDWDGPLGFLEANGFTRKREMINYWTTPAELPTRTNREQLRIRRLGPSDLPALLALGQGVIRLPEADLEEYIFRNPYFPAESFVVLSTDASGGHPIAIGVGLESSTWADVRKVDPLAPCFRLGAFGTEGLTAKRVNGLFSYVAKPEDAIPAGLALLAETSNEMTEGSVEAIAAQCPSDAPHLVGFFSRYFKEQGRFPVLILDL